MYRYRCDRCGKVIHADPADERLCSDCQEALAEGAHGRKADMPATESRAGCHCLQPVQG